MSSLALCLSMQSTSKERETFWIDENRPIDVRMMHQTSLFNYGYIDELDATALEMPYENSDVSFLILLPKKLNGLKALETKLKDVNFAGLTERLRGDKVSVAIPKFRVEHEIDLQNPLEKVSRGFKCIFPETNFRFLDQFIVSLSVRRFESLQRKSR